MSPNLAESLKKLGYGTAVPEPNDTRERVVLELTHEDGQTGRLHVRRESDLSVLANFSISSQAVLVEQLALIVATYKVAALREVRGEYTREYSEIELAFIWNVG